MCIIYMIERQRHPSYVRELETSNLNHSFLVLSTNTIVLVLVKEKYNFNIRV